MADFKPITTQEELEEVLRDRLQRQADTLEKKYADYDSLRTKKIELEKQLATFEGSKIEFEKTINELSAKVKDNELSSLKIKYAIENGIPYHLANRITGEDEEAIKEDAFSLAEVFKNNQPKAPLKVTEPTSKEDAEYIALIEGLKGE